MGNGYDPNANRLAKCLFIIRVTAAVVALGGAVLAAIRVQSDVNQSEIKRLIWWWSGVEVVGILFWACLEYWKVLSSAALVVAGLFGASLNGQLILAAKGEGLERVGHLIVLGANLFFIFATCYEKHEKHNVELELENVRGRSYWEDRRTRRKLEKEKLTFGQISDFDPENKEAPGFQPETPLSDTTEESEENELTVCQCDCFTQDCVSNSLRLFGLALGIVGLVLTATGFQKICDEEDSCGSSFYVVLWAGILLQACLFVGYVVFSVLRAMDDIQCIFTIYMSVPMAVALRSAGTARVAIHHNETGARYYLALAGCFGMFLSGLLLVMSLAARSCRWTVPSPQNSRRWKFLLALVTLGSFIVAAAGFRNSYLEICSDTVDCKRKQVPENWLTERAHYITMTLSVHRCSFQMIWPRLFQQPVVFIIGLTSVFAEPNRAFRPHLLLLPLVTLGDYPIVSSHFIQLWKDGILNEVGGAEKHWSFGITTVGFALMCLINYIWIFVWGWDVKFEVKDEANKEGEESGDEESPKSYQETPEPPSNIEKVHKKQNPFIDGGLEMGEIEPEV